MRLNILVPVVLRDNAESVTLNDYITDTIAPMLYFKFNEASGDLLNYGSEAGADGTVTGATQGQAGPSYLYDGVDDIIAVAALDIPNVRALTTQRWAFLVNPTSLGESNAGMFFAFGAANRNYMRFASSNQLQCVVLSATTSALAISAVNTVQDIIGNQAWVFMDYDHDTSRVIRFWKGINGTLTELVKATDTASVGTKAADPDELNIGNLRSTSLTFHGSFYTFITDSGLWTTAEMQQLIDLAGV